MNTTTLRNGILGGLAGGLVFGMMMAMMGMLPMIGRMAGVPTALGGMLVHLLISAGIGVGFALILGRRARSRGAGLRLGMLYGAAWWLLGPLTLMPLMMGRGFGVAWNGTALAGALPSLMGHLIYGVVLGTTFARLSGSGACPSTDSLGAEVRVVGDRIA